MFAAAPESEALFGSVDGVITTKLRAQGSRISTMVNSLIGVLDMDGVVQELLAHLRAQHAAVNLKPEYYKARQDWSSRLR